jgi:hypothetical protein
MGALLVSGTWFALGQAAELPTPANRPKAAHYYSAQRLGQGVPVPPLPGNPFPELPVYPLDERSFVFDDREVNYEQLRREAGDAPVVATQSFDQGAALEALGECASELLIYRGSNTVTLTITNATEGRVFDLYRTFELSGDSITSSFWLWVTRGSNGQSFTFPTCPCPRVFYVLGCTNDTDGDGLSDAFEVLVNKTSPTNAHSVNVLYTDREMVNVLVNDPEQDCGNEQNTQFESTCAVLGSNVIVAYVDSNRGVYGLGDDGYGYLTNRAPRLVGYALSRDGGQSFQDQDAPPLSRAGAPTDDDGDAGDPVLAVDSALGFVYLVGTSPRNQGHKGIPLWRSTNAGLAFPSPIIVDEGIMKSDKPWIAVDNGNGTGQHDVYLACTGRPATNSYPAIWLSVSIDGLGASWTNSPLILRQTDGTSVGAANSPIVQVGPDHVAYAFWFERAGSYTNGTNWLMSRQILKRGASLGPVHSIRRLVTTHGINGNLELKRSNIATSSDVFNAWPFPVPAVNPATDRAGHLYVAYADRGENSGDKADIYLVCSTNGGAVWTEPVRVNTVWTNDQWMPVLAVKPDGTTLFLAWYDRRNDTNNSLIDVYGRWGAIDSNGAVMLTNEFRISSVSFPPVFAGTRGEIEPIHKQPGFYDPVYPPGGVNLHWWYPEWPPPTSEPDENVASSSYSQHVGEYNGAASDVQSVAMTWTDSRLTSAGTLYPERQRDIRFIRIYWPQ